MKEGEFRNEVEEGEIIRKNEQENALKAVEANN